MAEVETARALLVMALQDLQDGETQMETRLPQVRENASDSSFSQLIADDTARSGAQRERLDDLLRDLGEDGGDTDNIWVKAILDDADNDAQTIAAGSLRDIALVGALRKGKQSERVSYETAIGLAERLELADHAQTLRTIRDEEQAADDALAALLAKLCKGLDTG